MQLSIIIPLLNEADSLKELHQRIQKVCEKNEYSYEIIFIDDGSTDKSWKIIQNLSDKDKNVKGIQFGKNYGKSQALHAAFKEAQGKVVITMDADLQDFPEEIPSLYKKVIDEDNDLVSGWKRKRFDNKLTKNLPSKLFNWAARKTSGVHLHDFNCGLKAYKNEVVKSVDVHGDMHRYIPVLAKNAGFNKIVEKEVKHQARIHGKSKFGANRFTRGFLDLITLWFVSRFGARPMHFFGLLGTLMFLLGFFTAFFIGLHKLFVVFYCKTEAQLVTQNPWFYIALVSMILGTQLFIAGFLGEMIVQSRRERKDYHITEKINL